MEWYVLLSSWIPPIKSRWQCENLKKAAKILENMYNGLFLLGECLRSTFWEIILSKLWEKSKNKLILHSILFVCVLLFFSENLFKKAYNYLFCECFWWRIFELCVIYAETRKHSSKVQSRTTGLSVRQDVLTLAMSHECAVHCFQTNYVRACTRTYRVCVPYRRSKTW